MYDYCTVTLLEQRNQGMNVIKQLFTITIVLLVSACSSNHTVNLPQIESIKPELSISEKKLLGEDVHWGIALSGGGIRSAAFQIGVLKQLYDQPSSLIGRVSFDDFKIISAVSGGGYASHLIYTNYYFKNEKKSKFGFETFDDSVFAESLCNIYTKGNFVVYPKWLISGKSLPDYYEQQIRRTFSPNNVSLENRNLFLSNIASDVANHTVPYPIYNFTVNGSDVWKARLFEVTPIQQGNEFMGYTPYEKESLTFSRAATISGAAIESLLKQEIDAPIGKTNPYGSKLIVHDGGKSENLGAIALIRRGIPNIIVSDAEHDPDMVYEGLNILIKEVIREGFSVEQITIENAIGNKKLSPDMITSDINDFKLMKYLSFDRLKSEGFSHFLITKGDTTIQMFYIKMQKPKALFPNYESTVRKDNFNKGWIATRDINAKIKNKEGLNCEDANQAFHNTVMDHSYSNWLRNVYWDYDYFIEDGTGLDAFIVKTKIFSLNLLSKLHDETRLLNYEFPHISTTDQSFAIDQSIALVGLGYHQGKLIVPYINNYIQGKNSQ
jgi:hypothetical protein